MDKHEWKVRNHMTHTVSASSAIKAIAHIASVTGAVSRNPAANVLTVSMLTAATIVLHANTSCSTNVDRGQANNSHFSLFYDILALNHLSFCFPD